MKKISNILLIFFACLLLIAAIGNVSSKYNSIKQHILNDEHYGEDSTNENGLE